MLIIFRKSNALMANNSKKNEDLGKM